MPKRGHGEGSVYLRAKGTPDEIWVGVAHLGWYDGKRQRKAVYGKTRALAAARLREVQSAVESGKVLTPERLTVGDFLDQWLADARNRLRYTSYRNYEAAVRLHLKPVIGHIRLRKLTTQDVQQVINAEQQAGLSAARIAGIRTVLGRALKTAVRWGLTSNNPASFSQAPQVIPPDILAMPPEEARAYLAALASDEYAHEYTIGITTGMRLGELLGSRWVDIDLDAALLTVTGNLQRRDGQFVRVEPGTKSRRRTIVLPPLAVETLKAQREKQEAQRSAAGDAWSNPLGLVFTRPKGEPVYGTTVNAALKSALRKAGLRVIHFHELRHAFATISLGEGVELKVVQENLGHTSIAVTANIYAHVLPKLRRNAAAKIEAALRGAVATPTATGVTENG